MPFRFRKTIRIASGLRLNVSKGGISASVGTRGATLNIGRRGTRGTVGVPGSGISYSEKIAEPGSGVSVPLLVVFLGLLAWALLH